MPSSVGGLPVVGHETNDLTYGSIPAPSFLKDEQSGESRQAQGLLNRWVLITCAMLAVSGIMVAFMVKTSNSSSSIDLSTGYEEDYSLNRNTKRYRNAHRHSHSNTHSATNGFSPTASPSSSPSTFPSSATPSIAPSSPGPTVLSDDGGDDFAFRKAADGAASPQTIALLTSLTAVRDDDKVLFGHQHDNYIGQYFLDKAGTKHQSDVYNGTGSYPGVFGYDFIEVLDNHVNYSHHVRFAYEQGAVITFDWKADNPITGGDPEDKTGKPCKDIVFGRTRANRVWNKWLERIAVNIDRFRKIGGEPIPIVFRFLHENTGAWYWWGTGTNDKGEETCSNDDYIALWNYTQWYLHDYKGLHNILWMYAPSSPRTDYNLAFHERYPGDTRVDVIGFDLYTKSVSWYRKVLLEDCQTVANFSLMHNKVPVIGETGMSHGMMNITEGEWYYDDFLKIIMEDDLCQNVAYVLTWENSHPSQYWVPLPQDLTWTGFKKLYDSDWSLFADSSTWTDLTSQYGYTTDDD